MKLLDLDELALERIFNLLSLNDLWALETVFPEIKYLTNKVFERVTCFPVEGKNYRFKKYDRADSTGKVRIPIYANSYIDVVARCSNLKELRLMHVIHESSYECGLKIGESCVQLEKVVGCHNSFEFVQGVMDGLLENIGYDEVQLKEITLMSLANSRQLKTLRTWINCCPQLVKIMILMGTSFDLDCLEIFDQLVQRPNFKFVLPTSMQHKLLIYRRDRSNMQRMLIE